MSRDTDRLIEQLALEVVPVRPLASPMPRPVSPTVRVNTAPDRLAPTWMQPPSGSG